VRDCISLITDKIVQAVRGVGVNEAIPNPLTRPDGLIDCGNQFNSGLYSILIDLASIQTVDIFFA
jgi:hypothetical protein